MDNKDQTQTEIEQQSQPAKKPNETAGFYFSSFLKISDPETKEVLVQMRGDN